MRLVTCQPRRGARPLSATSAAVRHLVYRPERWARHVSAHLRNRPTTTARSHGVFFWSCCRIPIERGREYHFRASARHAQIFPKCERAMEGSLMPLWLIIPRMTRQPSHSRNMHGNAKNFLTYFTLFLLACFLCSPRLISLLTTRGGGSRAAQPTCPPTRT